MAKVSVKHIQISKDQTNMLVVIALTTAFVVFALFATKAMVVKGLYQKRALTATRKAVSDLKTNYESAQKLMNQYKVFAEQNPNMLGGVATGNGNLDGENPRVTLDSLPSLYDAPALATSVEKIMTDQNVKITTLDVKDDPESNSDKAEASPAYKTIPITLGIQTNYDGSKKFLQAFEKSIRPFNVTSLNITGTDNNLTLTVALETYFQPAKSLDLTTTKEVK